MLRTWSMKKTKWGIIGLGNIAGKFAKDLALVKEAELSAVASRDLEKAKMFAETYNADAAYGSYEKLLIESDAEVIYIATPHNFHFEHAMLALQHGKHVLCEKPIGVNSKQLEEMIALAKQKKRFLMEALWSRFNPTIKMVKELVDAETIGAIGYVNADFTFYGLDRGDGKRLLNPNLAGDSLLDIGIYPPFFAYLFLGKPKKIYASANFYKTGIEQQVSIILDYENAQAILHSGLGTHLETKAKVVGTTGSIHIGQQWHMAETYKLERNNEIEEFSIPTTGMGYYYEILEVMNCLNNGKTESELWSLQDSRNLLKMMDDVRKIIGVKFPFE